MGNFWEGKEPCWILMNCSEYVFKNCPAYHYRERPCWEIPYTRCEALTNIEKECRFCKVYKLYNHDKKEKRDNTDVES